MESHASSSSETSIELMPPRNNEKLNLFLGDLHEITSPYHIINPADFLLEILFKEAFIAVKPLPTNSQFETCGVRGSDFFTIFIQSPADAIANLVQWLKTCHPTLQTASLESLTDEEESDESLTVISLNHNANITMNIDAAQKILLPLIKKHLSKDAKTLNKLSYLRRLEDIVFELSREQIKSNSTAANSLIQLLNDLITHLKISGLETNTNELKAQIQNIINEHESVVHAPHCKNDPPFFKSSKLFQINKNISSSLIGIVVEICNCCEFKMVRCGGLSC